MDNPILQWGEEKSPPVAIFIDDDLYNRNPEKYLEILKTITDC